MAKAITHLNKRGTDSVEEQQQAIDQLIEMVADRRYALIAILDIFHEAHAAGITDIMKGVLKTRHKALTITIQQLSQPAVYQITKNVLTMIGLLGEFDSKKMETMFSSFEHGVTYATKTMNDMENTTIWDLVKILKDPDINRAITMLIGFLKGMGGHLNMVDPEKN